MYELYFFGCWNGAGHFLYLPGGVRASSYDPVCRYGPTKIHIDGMLAPRKLKDGTVVWVGMREDRHDRDWLERNSREYPQGHFLRHELDTGYSIIQWWDRCQGDTRGACNSSIIAKGRRSSLELVELATQHFPHVLENLQRHKVKLSEVKYP